MRILCHVKISSFHKFIQKLNWFKSCKIIFFKYLSKIDKIQCLVGRNSFSFTSICSFLTRSKLIKKRKKERKNERKKERKKKERKNGWQSLSLAMHQKLICFQFTIWESCKKSNLHKKLEIPGISSAIMMPSSFQNSFSTWNDNTQPGWKCNF